MASLNESISFLGQFLARPNEVGALAPSSRFLAKALTRPLSGKDRPVNILEVGAGTGAVTRHIAPLLGPQDRLDICEANPKLAGHLREHVLRAGPRVRHGQVRLFAEFLQEVDDLLDYDYIVSGLPLTAFKLPDVRAILALLKERSRPGCTFSYFEYFAVRPFLATVRVGKSRRTFRELSAYLNSQIRSYQVACDFVGLNVPPALVRHFKFDQDNTAS